MGRESYALLTGLFVVVLTTALVVIAVWLGGYGKESDVYLVTTQRAVSGLKPESTVYFRGVEAGKVAGMGFDPQDSRTIWVRIELQKGLPITTATQARLRVQPLTGLAQIELDNNNGRGEPLTTDQAHPAVIPMRPSLLDDLTNTGQDLLDSVGQLMANLNGLLGEENRGRTQRILVNLEEATARLTQMEGRLDKALEPLPALGADARRSLAKLDRLGTDLQGAAQGLRGFTEQAQGMVAAGRGAVPRLNGLLDELHAASVHIKRLAGQLEREPQSLLMGPAQTPPGPGEPGYEEAR